MPDAALSSLRLTLLTAALALLAALAIAPGQADAAFTEREANRSVNIASNYWQSLDLARFQKSGARCRQGRVRVDWFADMGDSMASATLDSCRDEPVIKLERPTVRRLPDYHACAVITHEYGHLLGFRHVRRQASLMSGTPSAGARPPRRATWDRAWSRCRRAL